MWKISLALLLLSSAFVLTAAEIQFQSITSGTLDVSGSFIGGPHFQFDVKGLDTNGNIVEVYAAGFDGVWSAAPLAAPASIFGNVFHDDLTGGIVTVNSGPPMDYYFGEPIAQTSGFSYGGITLTGTSPVIQTSPLTFTGSFSGSFGFCGYDTAVLGGGGGNPGPYGYECIAQIHGIADAGQAIATYQLNGGIGPGMHLVDVTYTFADSAIVETPEPSAFLLLPGAVAVLRYKRLPGRSHE